MAHRYKLRLVAIESARAPLVNFLFCFFELLKGLLNLFGYIKRDVFFDHNVLHFVARFSGNECGRRLPAGGLQPTAGVLRVIRCAIFAKR